WLGGMLTNFSTVYKRLQRLKELELIEQTGGATVLTKKEALVLDRERKKLVRTLGGIREMTRTPSAVWVVDTNKEHLAVNEARKLGIPVVAILDTNCDPDVVDYKIPGNDDAIRSIGTLTRVIADAVAEGLMARAGAQANAGADTKPEAGQLGTDEPLPAWEQELLSGDAAAATDAPAPVEGAGAPVTEATPATEAPATEAPATEAPATEAPATEAPATEAPSTEAPSADAPSA
ncbi:MAG: ribosomal protein, partial [Frankiales bacterium]|nr:ribosomal protein [Frankiales bacterium]